MSARGARSRKAVTKDIEKQEKKTAVQQKAPVKTIRRPNDAFDRLEDYRFPTRHPTISSDSVRMNSRTSSGIGSNTRPQFHTVSSSDFQAPPVPDTARPRNSISGSTTISDDSSTKGKDNQRYDAKGKETKAPRGRGGGVPVKRPANSTLPPLLRAETSLSYANTHQKNWMNFREWQGPQGVDRPMKPYAGFDFDEHLHSGTVMIYFKEEQINEDRPVPQLRAELDVLMSCGSTWLSNALLYGRLDDDTLIDDGWMLPGSPESSLSPQALSPNFPTPPGQRMLGPTSPAGQSPPPFQIDQQYYGVPSSVTASMPPWSDMDTPSSQQYGRLSQQQPTHELWFTAPEHCNTPQLQRLHFVAIRNFLAMLHNKPIIGTDFYTIVASLQSETVIMFDLDHDAQSQISANQRSVQLIIDYMTHHHLDDVRRSIKQAMCLLAWCELEQVKWRQGYLETFVHLAGVLSPQLEEVAEFKRLSVTTRRNLGFASKQLQLRVIEAEEKLGPFEFEGLWSDPEKAIGHPVHQSYQAFRKFLIDYYTRIYGDWPPVKGKTWLNRKVVLDLQQDFGALYDYLVNRDVIWDSREERPGKKWQMVNRKTEGFRADRPDLSVTDMLVTYDNEHGYLHIPHPYPLLPREVPQSKPVSQKKGLFGLKKSKGEPPKDAKAHLQLSIIYSDATNIDRLDNSFKGSALIDAYERFELSAELKLSTTPREARLGRWILIYGVLQCLSTLSVDVLGLKHTDGVRYLLNADLKRVPLWVTDGEPEKFEATQERSFCWSRSWHPTPAPGAPVELDGQSVVKHNYAGMRGGELDAGTMYGSSNPNAYGNTHNSAPRPTSRNNTKLAANNHYIPPNDDDSLQRDIRRISEKIDHLSLSETHSSYDPVPRALDIRRDNEKVMQQEFAASKRRQMHDATYRLTESDYATRPIPSIPYLPERSPLRSPGSGLQQPPGSGGDGGESGEQSPNYRWGSPGQGQGQGDEAGRREHGQGQESGYRSRRPTEMGREREAGGQGQSQVQGHQLDRQQGHLDRVPSRGYVGAGRERGGWQYADDSRT